MPDIVWDPEEPWRAIVELEDHIDAETEDGKDRLGAFACHINMQHPEVTHVIFLRDDGERIGEMLFPPPTDKHH
jgi:hypothetical protein